MPRVLTVVTLVIALVACGGGETPPTTTVSGATTDPDAPSLELGGLVPADPATLIPLEDASTIVSGEGHIGVVAPDRRWALVRSTREDPLAAAISVIDVPDEALAYSSEGTVAPGMTISDEGIAHYFDEGRLTRLGPEGVVTVDSAPVAAPAFSGTLADLGDGRLGYLTAPGEGVGPVLLVVVAGDDVTVHEVEGVEGGQTSSAAVVPAVVFDAAADRAIVVSAEADTLVVVDLIAGHMSEHPFTGEPGLGDEPATRDVVISDDGARLFIATSSSESTGEGGQRTAVETASSLVVVETVDWASRALDVPAWAVTPSPTGDVVATTGGVKTLSADGSTEIDQAPVYVVDVAQGEPVVGFEGRSGTIYDLQFSADGAEMYVLSEADEGTNIDIVDMATLQLAGSVAFNRISLVGEAGLMAFHLD
jgi:hypothetical protein